MTVFANGTGEDKKAKTNDKTEIVSTDPGSGQDAKGTDEKNEEKKKPELKETAQDSASNSVNKLNFIFYFIYKNKYSSPGESLRKLFE